MKILLLIGNGFTIDFLKTMGKHSTIDVGNLFSKGADVRWPANDEPGFLSYKNCPNLWNLGARSTLSEIESISLIEDIITCANVFAYSPSRKSAFNKDEQQLYVKAYAELSLYLRHLFVGYDKSVEILESSIRNWHWAAFLEKCHLSQHISEVKIVTYNYDIWLERSLKALNIPFRVEVIGKAAEDTSAKVAIFKPHGSISFAHQKCGEDDAFNIPYDRDIHNAKSSEFEIQYDDLQRNFLMNAMIPPAGDSDRLKHSWAAEIRNKAKLEMANLNESDMAIICGLSYWHVDRAEIDELLIGLDPNINMKMINPAPPRVMSAVLTSLFRNYIHHTSAQVLKELIK